MSDRYRFELFKKTLENLLSNALILFVIRILCTNFFPSLTRQRLGQLQVQISELETEDWSGHMVQPSWSSSSCNVILFFLPCVSCLRFVVLNWHVLASTNSIDQIWPPDPVTVTKFPVVGWFASCGVCCFFFLEFLNLCRKETTKGASVLSDMIRADSQSWCGCWQALLSPVKAMRYKQWFQWWMMDRADAKFVYACLAKPLLSPPSNEIWFQWWKWSTVKTWEPCSTDATRSLWQDKCTFATSLCLDATQHALDPN